MAKDRSSKKRSRKENTREERKSIVLRELLTFSFKDLDQSQPKNKPETVELWQELNLLPSLIERLKELSTLTRDELSKQGQIKIYSDFPPKNKTDFTPPPYIDQNVAWGSIKGLGGKIRVIGYLSGNTFYIVFLDSEHRFWKSEKKHT